MRNVTVFAAALLALFFVPSLFAKGKAEPGADLNPAVQTQSAHIIDESANDQLVQGNAAFEQQDYEAAIAAYTKAIELAPDYAEAYAFRGRAYSYLPDSFEQAITDCEKAIGLNPNIAEAYFALGRAYAGKGDVDAAIENYTKAVEIKPDYWQAWVNRGGAYYAKGELDLSIADYTQALKINPEDAIAYTNRGLAYQDKGELDLAIADFTQAIQFDPNDALAYQQRGFVYYNKGEQDAAIADYTRALQLNPDDVIAYNRRGCVYDDKGWYDLAIMDYTRALQIDPTYAAVYSNRGNAYSHKGELNLAIADHTRSLQIDPDNAYAYNGRGVVYFTKGEWDLAIADFSSTLQIDPNFVLAYGNRGAVYSAKGEYDLAIADYTQAIGINPNYPAALSGRAAAYEKTGKKADAEADYYQAGFVFESFNYDLAIENFDKALDLNPANADAFFQRGWVYQNKKDLDAAIADYTRAININPNNAVTYYNRGLAHQDKGESDLAIADYTETLRADANHAWAYGNRGLLYANKGELDLAIDDFTKSIKFDPENTQAYFNRGNAYSDQGELDLALADYDSALRLNPSSAWAFSGRAGVYLKQKKKYLAEADYYSAGGLFYASNDMDLAIKNYTKIIEVNPNNADAYLRRGYAHNSKNEHDLAIVDFTQVIRLDPNNIYAYGSRGGVYSAMGKLDLAIADYTRALQIDPDNVFDYSMRALAYQDKQEYDLSIADYTRAIEIDPNYSMAYLGRGNTYWHKGDFDSALEDYTALFQIDPNYAVSAYIGRGIVYHEKGAFDLAIADYSAALQINPFIAIAYNNRAWSNAAKGEYDLAIGDYAQAVKIDPNNPLPYWNRAFAYQDKGDLEAALSAFSESVKISMLNININSVFDQVWGLTSDYYAVSQGKNKDKTFAKMVNDDYWKKYRAIITDGLEQAISRAEGIRTGEGARGASNMAQRLYIYYATVDMEVASSRPDKAFEYAESLRSRDFLEEVGREAALNLPGVKLAEREKIRSLSREIEDYQSVLDSYNREHKTADDRYAETSRKLDEAETARTALDNAIIARRVPRYEELRYPRPIDIEKAKAFCGEDTAVLEYVLWDDSIDYQPIAVDRVLSEREKQRPAIGSYCLVLTKDGVTPVLLDSGFDYNGTVKRFRDVVSKGRNLEGSRNALYEHLITPVLPHLPAGVKNIIIIPDGDLAYLPFDILRETYESPDFGETYALSLSPSVSVSMLAAKEGDLRNMAILAFADAVYNMDGEGADRGQRAFDGEKWINLPGTAAEVGAVQRIADEQNRPIAVYLKEDVSEGTIKYLSVRGELARYPIIHFACHGYFNEDEPGRSGIVMSEVSREHEEGDENDGYLTIPEIMALNFSAGMVLLSACETGLGEMRRGQGMVGLARAFLVSGTGSIGVSLWKIDDTGTSLFMTALYKKVLAEGKPFREAYYEVKNAFRHGEFGEDYTRPMYWAAFTMYE